MTQQVAVDFEKNGEYRLATLVARKGGWSTVINPDTTEEVKVRNSQIDDGDEADSLLEREAELTDVDDDRYEDEPSGDVFPAGIRDTYVRTQLDVAADGKTRKKTLLDCGDYVANQLRGKNLNDTAALAEQMHARLLETEGKDPAAAKPALEWIEDYRAHRIAAGRAPLNPGMIRMNIGNKIRGMMAKIAKLQAEAADTNAK